MPGPSAFEPPHIILPTALHTHTIIALHGRGSQGPEVCLFLSYSTSLSVVLASVVSLIFTRYKYFETIINMPGRCFVVVYQSAPFWPRIQGGENQPNAPCILLAT